jgi:SAM-dependent methyltransferase
MFSAADLYERLMGRWSRKLAPLLVKFAGVCDGDAVLDVGSGTGALSDAVIEVAPMARVIGIEPAPTYVALARTRHPVDRVGFEVGDAHQLPFDAGVFNCTLSLLALNFMAEPGQALDEMIRVTKPGGVVAGAAWDYGHRMRMLRIFWDEAVTLNPAADPRDERHMPLCRPGEPVALWRKHGLRNSVEVALTIQMRFSSFDDYWSPFLGQQGPAGTYVATLSPRDREALRRQLRKRLLRNGADHAMALGARAWAVKGIVPDAHSAR